MISAASCRHSRDGQTASSGASFGIARNTLPPAWLKCSVARLCDAQRPGSHPQGGRQCPCNTENGLRPEHTHGRAHVVLQRGPRYATPGKSGNRSGSRGGGCGIKAKTPTSAQWKYQAPHQIKFSPRSNFLPPPLGTLSAASEWKHGKASMPHLLKSGNNHRTQSESVGIK